LGKQSIKLRYSQQELGNMIGTTREAVNKVLREWEVAGVISLQRGALMILNTADLQTIIDEASAE